MTVRIHIDNESGFTEEDKSIIAALNVALNGTGKSPIGEVVVTGSTPAAPATTSTKAPTPAKKAAAAKAPAEDKDDDGDSTGDDRGADEALKAAGALVSDGKAKVVKETLAKFDAAKVSDLKPGQHGPFIDALTA